MSGKKKRQAALRQKAAKKEGRRRLFWRLSVIALVIVAVAAVGNIFFRKKAFMPANVAAASATPLANPFPKIPTLDQLIAMTPAQLANVDVAVMNLRCAEGLPGSEGLDIAVCQNSLNKVAADVKFQTDRNFYRFRNNPEDYEHSEPYFRLLFLSNIVQQDFGVRYNLAQIIPSGDEDGPNDHFYDDSRNLFIHGVLETQMGTCSSLPVFYVAVGRRLGYPLSLVAANGHYFVRWNDNRTKLNFEATSSGFVTHPDGFYRKWPEVISPKQEQEGYYLKDMSPSQELADFLDMRAILLLKGGKIDEAQTFFEEAATLIPTSAHQAKETAHFEDEIASFKADTARQVLLLTDPLGDDDGEQAAARAIELSRQRRMENGNLSPPAPRAESPPNSIYNSSPTRYSKPLGNR